MEQRSSRRNERLKNQKKPLSTKYPKGDPTTKSVSNLELKKIENNVKEKNYSNNLDDPLERSTGNLS